MTSKELQEDERGKYQAILATELLLLKHAEVIKTKLRASPRQLAWVQEVDDEQKLFWVTLSRYQPGVWRLCSNLRPYVPKVFWGKETRRLMPSFKWSFLPYEYNPIIVARILWAIAVAGDDAELDLHTEWPIFPKHPFSYIWSTRADNFQASVRKKSEEAERLRKERRSAR